MGGNQTKLVEQLNDNYKTLQTIETQQFGTILEVEELDNKNRQYLREFIFQDKPEYEDKLQSLRQIQQNQETYDQQNLIKITRVESEANEEFCSKNYKIFMFFEAVKSLYQLAHEQNNVDFSRQQLYNIMRGTVNGLVDLKKEDLPHQDISLHSMYTDIDQQRVKISNPRIFDEQPLLQNKIMELHDECYLSPNQYKDYHSIQNDQPYENIDNLTKSDLFSLGATMLHLSLNESSNDIYQVDKVSYQQIKSKLQGVENKYGKTYRDHLQQLLIIDENDRVDLKTFQQSIQYEDINQVNTDNVSIQMPSQQVNQQVITNNTHIIPEASQHQVHTTTVTYSPKKVYNSTDIPGAKVYYRKIDPPTKEQVSQFHRIDEKEYLNSDYTKDIPQKIIDEVNRQSQYTQMVQQSPVINSANQISQHLQNQSGQYIQQDISQQYSQQKQYVNGESKGGSQQQIQEYYIPKV